MAPQPFAPAGTLPHYPPDLRVATAHLEINMQVDIDARRLDVRLTHRLRGKAGAKAVKLDGVALEGMQVSEFPGRWSYDGKQLRVLWDAPFDEDEERPLTLFYRVQNPVAGIVFSRHGHTGESHSPTFAVSDHETERARYWLACMDHPSIRPTLSLRIRARSELTVLAVGLLEDAESHADGTTTHRYVLDHPCPSYLCCFAVGEFRCWDGGSVDGIPIAAYATPRFEVADLERSFAPTAAMMRWMSARLGVPYPFPKYYQVAVPGIGGAMENISLVTWDDRFLLTQDLEAEERQLCDVINVHEMAHAWFGDHVVCRDHAHAWLKEGWATYMESCWLEATQGADAMIYDLWQAKRQYFRETDDAYRRPIVTRVYGSSWDLFDRHLYPGGAWRLHMLRCELGEDVFWQATRNYLERFGKRTADTADFQRMLEEQSGRSLSRFFDQWIHSPGYPHLKVRFAYDSEKRLGKLGIEQVPEGANDSVASSPQQPNARPPFVFELDLVWTLGATTHRQRLAIHEQRTYLAIPMEAEPDSLELDPEACLLAKIEWETGSQQDRRRLQSRHLNTRLEAGVRLASGVEQDLAVLKQAFANDSSWGARCAWAEAMGEARSAAACSALCELVASHQEPESLASVLRAAGTYRDAKMAQALRQRLDGHLPPRARQAALEALAKQRDRQDLLRLRDTARDRQANLFARLGAIDGLAWFDQGPDEMDAPGLVPLLELLDEPCPRLAAQAATALGRLAKRLAYPLRHHALNALQPLLRHPELSQRKAAIDGLLQAQASKYFPDLEAAARSLPAQDQPALARRLQALRSGESSTLPAAASTKLEDRIEALETKQRTLEQRVQELQSAKGDSGIGPA